MKLQTPQNEIHSQKLLASWNKTVINYALFFCTHNKNLSQVLIPVNIPACITSYGRRDET